LSDEFRIPRFHLDGWTLDVVMFTRWVFASKKRITKR
jgi:hypothetical protein